jgi:transcriptional regulator with XRE-family HTH domain
MLAIKGSSFDLARMEAAPMPEIQFGAELRSRRLAARMRAAEVARLACIDASNYRKMEAGKRFPSKKDIQNLVSIPQLLLNEEELTAWVDLAKLGAERATKLATISHREPADDHNTKANKRSIIDQQATDTEAPLPGTLQTMQARDFVRLPVYRSPKPGEALLMPENLIDHQLVPRTFAQEGDAVVLADGPLLESSGLAPGSALVVRPVGKDGPPADRKVIARLEGQAVVRVYRNNELGSYLEGVPGAPAAPPVPARKHVRIEATVIGFWSPM